MKRKMKDLLFDLIEIGMKKSNCIIYFLIFKYLSFSKLLQIN